MIEQRSGKLYCGYYDTGCRQCSEIKNCPDGLDDDSDYFLESDIDEVDPVRTLDCVSGVFQCTLTVLAYTKCGNLKHKT